MKVHKRRIADDAGVGVENAETDDERDQPHKQSQCQLPETAYEDSPALLEIPGKIAGEHHCSAINAENAPVRQSLF